MHILHKRRFSHQNEKAMKPAPLGLRKHIAKLKSMAIDYCNYDLRICTRLNNRSEYFNLKLAALKAAGCKTILKEKASGGRWDRPELQKILEQCRKGDVVVVWKLDRLSRSLRDVLNIMEQLKERGAGFKSLTESIDTTTAAGRMMMQMVASFAEFERAMLRERTKVGINAARKEGRIGGRPSKLSVHQQQEITKLVSKGKKTAADAARLFSIHPATVSRLIQKGRVNRPR